MKNRFCENCGTENKNNGNFCENCGFPMTQSQNVDVSNNKKSSLPVWVIVLSAICGLLFFVGILTDDELFDSDDSTKTTEKIAKEKTTTKKEDLNIQEIYKDYLEINKEVLYEYGNYYKGKTILTAIKISSKSSDYINAETTNNKALFLYSLRFDFKDKDEIKDYKEDDYVVIVGVVGKSSIGKTITVSNCHIISSGSEAKKKIEELEKNKAEQLDNAKKLKKMAEKAEKDKKQKDIDDYKKRCKKYSYKKIQRNPKNYKGKLIKVSGKVIQVSEGWFDTVTLRVEDSNSDIWYVTYSYGSNESKILEKDKVTVYGKSTGTTTYETIIGSSMTIPSISATYIDIK